MDRRRLRWTIALVLVVALAGVVAWLFAAGGPAALPPTFWVRIDEPDGLVYESPEGPVLEEWRIRRTQVWTMPPIPDFDVGRYELLRCTSHLEQMWERIRSMGREPGYPLELQSAVVTESPSPDARWRELRLLAEDEEDSGR